MKVTVSHTLSKSFIVEKDNNETLEQAFLRQHWHISALLLVLKDYLEYDLNHLNRKQDVSTKCLLNQLASCRDWTTDEFEVIKEHEIS